jgi:hypothetical protein
MSSCGAHFAAFVVAKVIPRITKSGAQARNQLPAANLINRKENATRKDKRNACEYISKYILRLIHLYPDLYSAILSRCYFVFEIY